MSYFFEKNINDKSVIENVISTFMELIILNNTKLNLTPFLQERIKFETEKVLKYISEIIAYAYIDEANSGENIDYQIEDEKTMFVKCLIKSIKQRVIIIREDLLQHKDSIKQPA